MMFLEFTLKLQMAPSCPVDRKPFTSVYRWDRNLSCEQVSADSVGVPPVMLLSKLDLFVI